MEKQCGIILTRNNFTILTIMRFFLKGKQGAIIWVLSTTIARAKEPHTILDINKFIAHDTKTSTLPMIECLAT